MRKDEMGQAKSPLALREGRWRVSLGAPRSARARRAAWGLLGLLTAAEALHELAGLGGPDALFTQWVHDTLIAAAAALCFARSAAQPGGDPAALAFGVGLACWAAGDVLWSALYGAVPDPPYPRAPDALWLAWYPFTAVGIALLIRARFVRFRLHQWMDGLAVMLIALTPCAALLLQPTAQQSTNNVGATVVNFSYPILDTLLIGAVLGVCGLTGWRPGRAWVVIGLGCVLMAVSDGLFAVQQARDAYIDVHYGFLWTAGGLLIALGVWQPAATPGADAPAVGWRAIALPLAAQAMAAGIQVYGLFHELGSAERLVTLIVLIVAMIQIVVARPRAAGGDVP